MYFDMPGICPLCSSQANFKEVNHGNQDYFDCESCGKYIIAKSAIDNLSSKNDEFKNNVKKMISTCDDDSRVSITCDYNTMTIKDIKCLSKEKLPL